MTRELHRVTQGLLIGFFVIAISAAFWPVIQADSLLARPDNARNVIAEQRIQRGTIYDQDGNRLAYSREDDRGVLQRVYPYPEAAGAVGYYSFTYGAAGIEAAYDRELRGTDLRDAWTEFVDGLLHRVQPGSDVRTTLDLEAQQAAAAALGEHSGAVVAVHVPSGRVLAMVSLPNYDPNRIDADWDILARDETTSPLLNRVTAGLYQPGGVLQTVWLAAMLAAYPDLSESGGYVLNGEAPGAHDAVEIQGLTLTCLPDTPDQLLTMGEAYVFGCPQPFVAALGTSLLPDSMWERLGVLGLLSAPELMGFETLAGTVPPAFDNDTPIDTLVAAVAGQGDLTVTPLQMVQIVAGIANRGNGVPLHLVDAVRPPGTAIWQAVPVSSRQPALLRADVADAVRLTMLQASGLSPYVIQARRGDLVMYGHSAQAFAGPDATPYVWFTGFVDQTAGTEAEAIAVVVMVENESGPGVAASVAGDVFEAVARAE